MASATTRRPLRRVRSVGIATRTAAFALLLALLVAGSASGESLPGPPLEGAEFQAGAYCPPRTGSAGMGCVGFAGAVAAIAFVAGRRRDLA